jgi:hypothetical protein
MLIGGVGILSGLLVPPAGLASRRHLPFSGLALAAMLVTLPWWHFNLLGYIIYIMVVLKFVADASELLPSGAPLKRPICLLGEYVLFCYLAQIFLLQVFQRLVWKNFRTPLPSVILLMLATSAALVAACLAVAAARRRFRLADVVYRAVFA